MVPAGWRKSFRGGKSKDRMLESSNSYFPITTEGSPVASVVGAGGLAARAEWEGSGAPIQNSPCFVPFASLPALALLLIL